MLKISCSFGTWTLFTSSLYASQLDENLYSKEKNAQAITPVKFLEQNLEKALEDNLQESQKPDNLTIQVNRDTSTQDDESSQIFYLPAELNQNITPVKYLERNTENIKKHSNYTKKTNKYDLITSNDNQNNRLYFYQEATEPNSLEILDTITDHSRYNDSDLFKNLFESKQILIAAPDNFNPSQKLPPPPPPKPPEPPKPPKATENSDTPTKPALVLENGKTELRDDFSKFKQHNRIVEETFLFGLRNGQKVSFKTGFNTFEQPKFSAVSNIPLQFGWQTKIKKYSIKAAGGIDIFNRLPIALNLNIQVDRPIFVNLTPSYKLESALFLSAVLEHGPYKSSAQTLENLITSWRTGLNAYWQINPNTSFFTLYRVGLFNDGNFEQQLFSRLEHKSGQFYAAGNLFAWGFTKDRQLSTGYFSPQNFLVYNAEIGWEGKIFDFLSCKLNTSLGRQILNGSTTAGNSYQAKCSAQISPNISFDFGYGFSKAKELYTEQSPYDNRGLSGKLNINF